MIPALIIWLCKKYVASRAARKLLKQSSTLSILLLVFCSLGTAKAETTKFAIKRNGVVIGQMAFSCRQEGENVFYQIHSSVNTRFLFKINVETQDYAHFKQGKLFSSSVKRLVNGTQKEPKETKWINNSYQTSRGLVIKEPINYNMMLLYAKEPTNMKEVYSDNFQCFVPIKKLGEHRYRVNLPDGNYNEYFFENGVCKAIIVKHSMYSIQMERV